MPIANTLYQHSISLLKLPMLLKAALLILVWPCIALGQQQSPVANTNALLAEPDFLPVAEAYNATPSIDDEGNLVVNWQLKRGYYLYKSRFSTELIFQGTKISVSPRYETGISKDDPYFGEVEVYYQQTHFSATDFPTEDALALALTSQGCADAGLCYPPYTVYFSYTPANGEFATIDENAYEKYLTTDLAGGGTQGFSDEQESTLIWALIFAFLGGIILNLMPCVFPVLGLKVLSLSNAEEGKAISHGLIYTAGVVLSFIGIAALLIALKSAGQAIGWGFQLQNPIIVATLATVFFVLGLNLLGLFEVGTRIMGTGDSLTRKSGATGSFFTGVLAVVAATPCTAPFMGSALGFASTQAPLTALLVFFSLGLGMAAPVLLLVFIPSSMRLMPKPGQWMNSFKQVLAFPLFATAVWLTWVVGKQTGSDGMATVLLSFVLVGFAIWLKETIGAGKNLVRKALILLSLASVIFLFTSQLQVRANLTEISPMVESNHVSYSHIELTKRIDNGEAVFLDVTAAWCITCKANESLVLNSTEIQTAFEEKSVVYMVADWTNYDPAITELLAQYRRNGIPLYLWFDGSSSRTGEILPQVLSKSIVLQKLSTL